MLTKLAAKIEKVIYSDCSEEAILIKVLPILETVGMDKLEMGFLDSKGNFYNRRDALALAIEKKQIKGEIDLTKTEWLSPLDLNDFPS